MDPLWYSTITLGTVQCIRPHPGYAEPLWKIRGNGESGGFGICCFQGHLPASSTWSSDPLFKRKMVTLRRRKNRRNSQCSSLSFSRHSANTARHAWGCKVRNVCGEHNVSMPKGGLELISIIHHNTLGSTYMFIWLGQYQMTQNSYWFAKPVWRVIP